MRGPILATVLWMGLLAAAPVQAWSAFGHRLVGLLAQDQVAPATRAELDELLALEPGADLGTIAAWADEIRDQPEYRHTAPFHYVNFHDGSCRFDAARDCANGNCIIGALTHYTQVLGDPSHPAAERLDALKFVVHFAGDIHQPMHAGNRDDRGGNRVQISLDGEGTNLHAVWDYHLLRSAGLEMQQYRAQLGPQVAQTRVEPMDFAAWAQSSCVLLDRAAIYPPRAGRLPTGYLERQRPLAEARITLAAARLAALLDRSLAPAAETSPEAE